MVEKRGKDKNGVLLYTRFIDVITDLGVYCVLYIVYNVQRATYTYTHSTKIHGLLKE